MTSRNHLIQYCLRNLGSPVVEVNVAPEQIEDRVDEALAFFHLYHYDGQERFYLTHKITSSQLTIQGTNAATFTKGQIITGSTSAAKALVESNESSSVIRVRNVEGVFLDGEVVTTPIPTTATLITANAYLAGDTENRWIPIPDAVYGITRVFPLLSAPSSMNLFDVQYQLMLNDIRNITSTDLTYYVQAMTHLGLLQSTLHPVPDFEFNRQMNRLRLDVNWKGRIEVDRYICVEAYRALNPTIFSKIWIEPWLRAYTTALIKRQWGINMKKFSGMKLPGGVTIDGNVMYQEAMIEIKQLETEMITNLAPLSFFLG